VGAAKVTASSAKVTWAPPTTVRPGYTISRYSVRDVRSGKTVLVGATKRSATLTGLAKGIHSFTVAAVYADTSTSGWATPSRSVFIG
jgi:hypothetical protein